MKDNTPTRNLSMRTRKIKISDAEDRKLSTSNTERNKTNDTKQPSANGMSTPAPQYRRQYEPTSPFDKPIVGTQEAEIAWHSPDPYKDVLRSRIRSNITKLDISPIGIPAKVEPKNLYSLDPGIRRKTKSEIFDGTKDLDLLENQLKSTSEDDNETNLQKTPPKLSTTPKRLHRNPEYTPKALFPRRLSAEESLDDSLDDLFNDSDVLRSTQAVEDEAYKEQHGEKRRQDTADPLKPPKTVRITPETPPKPVGKPQRSTFQLNKPLSKAGRFNSRLTETTTASSESSAIAGTCNKSNNNLPGKFTWKKKEKSPMCCIEVEDDSEDFASIVAAMDEGDHLVRYQKGLGEARLDDVTNFEDQKAGHHSAMLPSRELPKPNLPSTDAWPDDDWFASEDVLASLSQVEDKATKAPNKPANTNVNKDKIPQKLNKKCTEEEIARKREAALAKRKLKSQQNFS